MRSMVEGLDEADRPPIAFHAVTSRLALPSRAKPVRGTGDLFIPIAARHGR